MVLHNVVFDSPDVDQKTCLFGRQAERSELHLGDWRPPLKILCIIIIIIITSVLGFS